MKNKISDLRNHMFAALERLADPDLSKEDLLQEIEKSKAISELGKVIVDSAKTEVLYHKLTKGKEPLNSGFIDNNDADNFNEQKRIERPPAVYNGASHLNTVKKYAEE